MITTFILICFVLIYWMFSAFLVATLVTRGWTKDFDFPIYILITLLIWLIAPIVTPIISGLLIGNFILEKYEII